MLYCLKFLRTRVLGQKSLNKKYCYIVILLKSVLKEKRYEKGRDISSL